ncbi:MAG: hypothetical protein BWY85_00256 [Firmicutes bacterium ADurb.Bin506]|nr:MAG: hypothetical protein BWY85_00256 [Firmicutes bacterium ADurb.Bin506]
MPRIYSTPAGPAENKMAQPVVETKETTGQSDEKKAEKKTKGKDEGGE